MINNEINDRVLRYIELQNAVEYLGKHQILISSEQMITLYQNLYTEMHYQVNKIEEWAELVTMPAQG